MPGVYEPPDYDLAGFIVGYVDEDAILGPERVRDGDVLVGLESSGLHTNGYSLARRIVSDRMRLAVGDPFPGEEATVADVLLRVHRSYLPALKPVLSKIHAMAHITGGGIPGNLNRALPAHLDAVVNTGSWTVPNLFARLERAGSVDRDEMFRTFNMGVGMIVIADEAGADAVLASASSHGVRAWRGGRIVLGSGRVNLTQESSS
jgi:phosphoribosylformylglycinamidine cyclo-ligase